MGLTLHYELRLPATTPRQAALTKLRELHAFALTRPFKKVSALLLEDGESFLTDSSEETETGTDIETDTDSDTETDTDSTRHHLLQFWASIVAQPFDEEATTALNGDPHSAMGFFVHPGEGAETASFCLLRQINAAGENADWFWYCCCKTQYASNVSEAHFVACHKLLVQLLDHAITSGFEVTVDDEGFYWETRDEAQLIAKVRKMNTLIAGIAGQISDALGDVHDVRAPIFDHPRFERLEMGETDKS